MIDSGATAFILICTALVMLMTPAVGLFYGGLVRRKNFISMIALAFIAFALVSIQWIVCGYSLAFGTDIGGLIGVRTISSCRASGLRVTVSLTSSSWSSRWSLRALRLQS